LETTGAVLEIEPEIKPSNQVKVAQIPDTRQCLSTYLSLH